MADSLANLKPDPRNARRHTPRNVGMIESALREIGAARSIVIDETNTVLAGNATIEAAAAAGIERVQIVDADGETIIAVRRSGLTDAQKTKLALYDNRAAELAEWAPDVLAALADDGVDLGQLWFEDELADVLSAVAPPAVALTDPDAVPEPPAEPITKPGDLWLLGGHRLLCGDSTVVTDVDRLMGGERAVLLLTDPPYAVAYVDKARDMNRRGYVHSRATLGAAIQGDEIDEDAAAALWRDVFTLADVALRDNAAWYIWHAPGRAMLTLHNLLVDLGMLHHQTIIWVKNNFVIGRSDYQWKHEPCFYGWKKGHRPPFLGPASQTTVWDVARDTTSPVHPTQKPVEIFARPIANHCQRGAVIYDPFLGSGTTLIAAEQAGASCYGMEVSAAYCDVVIQRWEEYTGQTAQRAVTAEAAD